MPLHSLVDVHILLSHLEKYRLHIFFRFLAVRDYFLNYENLKNGYGMTQKGMPNSWWHDDSEGDAHHDGGMMVLAGWHCGEAYIFKK